MQATDSPQSQNWDWEWHSWVQHS